MKLPLSLVLLLIILPLVGFIMGFKSHELITTDKQQLDPTAIPLPTEAPVIEPTIPTTPQTPLRGKSSGIFFPTSQDVTINNNLPTIIGRIDQVGEPSLSTSYGLETSPATQKEENFLRFIPGRIKNNIKLKIDGVELKNVFGTAQFPTVGCDRKFFKNEQDCMQNATGIPPLIFFTRPDRPLSEGKHTISLERVYERIRSQVEQTMDFNIDSGHHLSSLNMFTVDINPENYYYDIYKVINADNCPEGYYYDENYLKVPLSDFSNPNIYYGISFPQNSQQMGNPESNRVQIVFESYRYDLFFPQSSLFYQDGTDGIKNPYHQLFLPKDHLEFSNGRKAIYRNISDLKGSENDSTFAEGYFEIYPVDITGGIYENSTIPWIISNNSGCDG